MQRRADDRAAPQLRQLSGRRRRLPRRKRRQNRCVREALKCIGQRAELDLGHDVPEPRCCERIAPRSRSLACADNHDLDSVHARNLSSQPMGRTPANSRVAILSLHSHGDRSFLDDALLALLSGDLRSEGIENDLVVAVLDPKADAATDPVEKKLTATLATYGVIVYERVWSRELIERLRAAIPSSVFVWCMGEHELENPPADWVSGGDLREELPKLVGHILGRETKPPEGASRTDGPLKLLQTAPPAPKARPFAPNVRPVIINPEAMPDLRIFSIDGNEGCAYQADARLNPLYAGIHMPEGTGRGCAFCTTGNTYRGKPNDVTAAFVLEQIRYLKTNAPELTHIVLKDQNPFAYLPTVVDGIASEGLKPLVLMLQTRADWFSRNINRFDRALQVAKDAGIRISPFLVGIENFSQLELDRFNKGMTADENVSFLDALWTWRDKYGDTFDLTHASFGFILLSPWTTFNDLRVNLDGIRRTRLDKLRGRLLVSRARLYPDTALYYLAERDGLLVSEFSSESENASARFGYYPSHPWKFADPAVGRFSEIAAQLDERAGARDELTLFECLLNAFAANTDYQSIDPEAIWSQYQKKSGASGKRAQPSGLRERFARLVQPLPFDGFASGWSFGGLQAEAGSVRVELLHKAEPSVMVELALHGQGPRRARSRHYDIRALSSALSPSQEQAVSLVCNAIVRNDA